VSRWRRTQMTLLWVAARMLGRRWAWAGGLLAAGLWFTPWPTAGTDASRAREARWLADTEPVEVVAGRWRLRGYTAGHGPTVLLVHGWGDPAARMGAFVAPLVGCGFRVVALHLPGHGPAGVRQVDLPTMAAALRDAAGRVGPVHAVIGHSLGGTVSMLAIRDGLSPSALVVLASPARLERAVGRFAELLDLPERAVQGLRRRIERRFGASVWDDYAADRLALEVPTLVIHDADDPQVDLAESRMLVAAWPRARLIETSGLGHQRIVRSDEVVAATVEFVAAACPPIPSVS
jgi:pimeloyl-ACP methyl ester carboxylesterase